MNGSYVLVDQFLENPKFMNSSLSLANAFATKKQIDCIWLLVSDIFTIVNTLLVLFWDLTWIPLPVNRKPQVLQNFEKWLSLMLIFNRQIYIDII